jgi:tRNA-(ms[2]io[6]A)-hydroxylase
MYKNVSSINDFLPCSTPSQWVKNAVDNQDILLIDHANCEKKAASMALSFLFKHPDKPDLCFRMSKIAREELVHYASGLRKIIHSDEVRRFIDLLIIGAVVEARSCERFEKIAPKLDPILQKFYQGLLESEKRHFTIYLEFAYQYAAESNKTSCYVDSRIEKFLDTEKKLIELPDDQFQFHSGPVYFNH